MASKRVVLRVILSVLLKVRRSTSLKSILIGGVPGPHPLPMLGLFFLGGKPSKLVSPLLLLLCFGLRLGFGKTLSY